MATSLRKFKETVEMRAGFFHRVRTHRHFSTGLVLAVFVIVACIHVWQRVHVIRLSQQVGALREENRNLIDATKKVRSEVAALSMGSRVESYAADSLGLLPVTAERLVIIDRDQPTKEVKADELGTVLSSIKRVSDHLPVLSEAQAEPAEFQPIRFDSLAEPEAEP
ncbi:hypothetical protein C3F09_02905 [candidate division GN15 bacterium]|uniref:Cell division protein FtsL n=1 Tax=candidate division GN15 bacterium TaxID=2072418 RepID=A0A855X455_9BACT|nr:MAG: hypothetical protein C3F09_02905 [candidate division GN15 bacterium]